MSGILFPYFIICELIKQGFSCSEIWCCANGQMVPRVHGNVVPLKYQEPLTCLHSAVSQDT
jgi:hypothetical protein